MNELKVCREIFDLLPSPVIEVVDGLVTYANPAAASKFYISNIKGPIAALLGNSFDDYMRIAGKESAAMSFSFEDALYLITVKRFGPEADLLIFTRSSESAFFDYDAITSFSNKLRAPLTTIFSVASLLFPKLEELEDNKIAQQISVMNKSFYRLLRLSHNINDGSKLLSGNASLFLENTDLCQLLKGLAEKVEPLCATLGIAFNVSLPSKPLIAAVDAQKIERALLNLISNSLKFTEKGQQITLRLSKTANNIHITVIDKGKGMTSDAFTTIFSSDGNGGLLTPDQKGLGLGFVIVMSIVKLHDGTVAIESGEGKGTNVTISLPIKQVSHEDTFKSKVANYDYAGGHSHALIELSDTLPPEVFTSENIN